MAGGQAMRQLLPPWRLLRWSCTRRFWQKVRSRRSRGLSGKSRRVGEDFNPAAPFRRRRKKKRRSPRPAAAAASWVRWWTLLAISGRRSSSQPVDSRPCDSAG